LVRCHIFKLKCTKIDYGYASDPAGAKESRGGEGEGKGRGRKGIYRRGERREWGGAGRE